ncbi:hypothetical protein CK203_095333 [Vitis vinifera]|uniref:Reverse transcriptase domain-containing protein n=1 Tax=Vitis vinifera TaxID=29760 RepID=A0A438E722_VITVI|nr:hypothetical protein CK203_095333 [Vitis vinifera]
MNLRILSWNVRGVNDRLKRKIIKSVIRSQKVDLFCLQETKVQVMSDEMVRSLGTGRYLDWKMLNAKGTAGGVIICWDKRSLEILGVEEGQFSISCRFRNEGDGAIWVFTGVYGPFSREDREGFMGELGAIRGLWEEPWCLGGDFNITLYIDDRNRTGRITSAMRRFAQIIDELGLVDIPLQGGSFTWSGGLNNQTRARLDRFLATPCWLDQFSRVLNRRLPRPTSDHFPILLEGGGVRRGPSPFKFENMWLKAEGFQELIKGWWHGIEVGEKQSRCSSASGVLGFCEEVRSLTEVELNQKKEAKESYEKWVSMEEVHWRQLSRELWLREGDRNTGFFHRMANAHRRINVMSKIMINGVSFTEDQDMREGIANAYQQLLSENPGWKADIGGLLMNQISPSESGCPGPGRIYISFLANSWENCQGGSAGLFKEFHDQNSFIKSLNHTFLVLIPKKGGVEELGDYRPINLLGGLYKLLAKVLANRIKKVIGKVISPDQNAFIKGRQILDGSLIANEVMQKMGFGSKWIGWMWYCISTVKYSVLVNGVPAGFFSSTKGCRIWRDREQAVKVTHLLFADDTIIFCEAKKEALLHLGWVLFWFEAASGLKINLDKSMVIPVGEVDGVLDMAAEIDVGWGNYLLFTWVCLLGLQIEMLPLGMGWRRERGEGYPFGNVNIYPKVWQEGLKNFKEIFCGAELTGGLRVIWLNGRRCVWEKEKGGLGLRKITILNKALLGKWIWRFACAKEEFWKKVLEAKYGKEEFGWRTRKANGAFGVGVWKEILKESTWCWENMGFKVGKGSRIRFWTDHWCGNSVLSQDFPNLFSMAAHRNVTVEECWDQNTGQGGWILGLLRDLNDWEVGLVGNILAVLRDYSVTMEDDAVCWKKGENGLFKIKYAYNVLANSHGLDFPHSNVWIGKVPTKIAFFAWEATWGKVLTLDRLQRRGWHLPNRLGLSKFCKGGP